jgi:hypothetical protein
MSTEPTSVAVAGTDDRVSFTTPNLPSASGKSINDGGGNSCGTIDHPPCGLPDPGHDGDRERWYQD